MSQTAFAVEDRRAALPFEALVETLLALGVAFRRQGEDLALRNGYGLTRELRAAVAAHKPELLALADVGADLSAAAARLHLTITRLRYEDPRRGTRGAALDSVAANIEKLAARALATGLAVGVMGEDGEPKAVMGLADTGDPFGGDEFRALRLDLAELRGGPYPVPLPAGCVLVPQASFDPFEHGRTYAGKVIGPCTPPERPQGRAGAAPGG